MRRRQTKPPPVYREPRTILEPIETEGMTFIPIVLAADGEAVFIGVGSLLKYDVWFGGVLKHWPGTGRTEMLIEPPGGSEPPYAARPETIALSTDPRGKRYVSVGDAVGFLRSFDAESGALEMEIKVHTHAVLGLSATSDSGIVTVGRDAESAEYRWMNVRTWSLYFRSQGHQLEVRGAPATAVAVVPTKDEGEVVFIGTAAGDLFAYPAGRGPLRRYRFPFGIRRRSDGSRFPDYTTRIRRLIPFGHRLILLTRCAVRVLDLQSGTTARYISREHQITAATPVGDSVAIGDTSGRIVVFDSDLTPLYDLAGDSPVTCLTHSDIGLISGHTDGAKIWPAVEAGATAVA